MFYFYFRSSLIYFRIFFLSFKKFISCLLWHHQFIGWWINHYFVLLVVICLSQLLKLFFFLFTSLIPLLLKIFSLLAKQSIKSFCCLSINMFCFLSWYVSLNCCITYASCLLPWYHFSWNFFILMDKESIKSFFISLITWRIYGFVFWIERIKNELEFVRI